MTAPPGEPVFDLLTPHEVASITRRSVHTVRQQMRDGKLPAVRHNGRWLTPRAKLVAQLTLAGGGAVETP